MKQRRDTHLKDLWKLGIFFYLIVFNYPFLEIFNHETPLLSIPLILFFLFGGWLLSIVLVFLLVRRVRRRKDGDEEARDGEGTA